MFSELEIEILFGNIVELNKLHILFYSDLLKCGPTGQPMDVNGLLKIIKKHIPTMTIAYSKYCSNFPHATAFYNRLVTEKRPRQTNRLRRRIGSINRTGFELKKLVFGRWSSAFF